MEIYGGQWGRLFKSFSLASDLTSKYSYEWLKWQMFFLAYTAHIAEQEDIGETGFWCRLVESGWLLTASLLILMLHTWATE